MIPLNTAPTRDSFSAIGADFRKDIRGDRFACLV
jgi:hypothetical protein